MANNISEFFFAWVNSSETTFNSSHQREDELIFSFSLKHDEGQFATLELEIINPHIGLLAPGRPFWAWFSWSDGTTVHPLFFGRLVGIPSSLLADVITVTLVAKPIDYTEQRLAIAAGLRVLPFFDPIFIDEKRRDDPDTVLEGYSALWHVDRVSHVVSISDVIAGEEGVEEFTPNDVFYDGVSLELAEAPLLVCEIDATVSWVQCDHTGVIEFKKEQFNPLSTAVADDMPQQEVNMGNGIIIKQALNANGNTASSKKDLNSGNVHWEWQNQEETHNDGDSMSASVDYSWQSLPPDFFTKDTIASLIWADAGERTYTSVTGDPQTGTAASASASIKQSFNVMAIDKALAQPVATDMEIGVEVEQSRTEVIHVRVLADVQPVLTEATETENNIKEKLSAQSSDVVAEGVLTASDGVYFPTARGLQSLEYLMMVARAHLLMRSRAVRVAWECPFSRVVGMSCRKNASIEDSRLPGGTALGKVVGYEMTGSGDGGNFIGKVTIGSAVGHGNPLVTAAGTPDYVNDGYVQPGYQHYSGTLLAAVTNDMAFTPLAYEATGLQLPISKDQILVRHEWNDAGQAAAAQTAAIAATHSMRQLGPYVGSTTFGAGAQGPPADLLAYVAAKANASASIDQAIRDTPAWLEIELAPVQNISTSVEYDANVSPLVIPMQIDLSAASTP
jgi:hypothetical protein